ncbi:hypothetical protein SEA_PEPE25_53 [Microbacterium phage Pepe25]|nr:hypothetical protein SEA_PEPE25_53 [Microbacterium phage Pepe25]
MAAFTGEELQRASSRQLVALRRLHRGLGAKVIKVGRWPFRRRQWQVSCSCGWVDPELYPVAPEEMQLVSNFILDMAMERHLVAELRKLTFAQVWLGLGQ